MLYLTMNNRPVKITAAVLAAVLMLMMPFSGCERKVTEKTAEDITDKSETRTTTTTAVSSTEEIPEQTEPYAKEKESALDALSSRMNESRECVYVYKDFGLSENHFTQKAKMYGINPYLADDLDENWSEGAWDGTCIRCSQRTREGDWCGWMWLNGYLPEGSTEARLNDGSMDGQGMDLTGAQRLTFYAKCDEGQTCTCEFFTCGFGYDSGNGPKIVDYPDSSDKRYLGIVNLTDEWQQFSIDIRFADLSYIVCGFGYVVNDRMNGNKDVVFYLDEIRFEGDIKYLKDAPMMIRSYDSENEIMKNCAYSYDNAVVLMSYVASDKKEEANKLADSFVYAIKHDRTLKYPVEGKLMEPMRVRNAYAAGDISPMPGWGFAARIPGWYDYEEKEYREDRVVCGSATGNTSYVALSLLQTYNRYGGEEYLDAAKSLMDWILINCSDGKNDGFTAGFDGWEEADPPVVYKNTYRSIEHNIDAYAAFKALYGFTGDERYKEASESAKRFIFKMYDPDMKIFRTGTGSDGVTTDSSTVVLDAQVWCAMALGDEFEPYKDALKTVEKMKTKEGGYAFCLQDDPKGFWCEGTAFTALLYRELGDEAKYKETMDALVKVQLEGGLFPAATSDGHSTGIYLFNGSLWTYGKDPHITPAAWMIMAATRGFNPYVMR